MRPWGATVIVDQQKSADGQFMILTAVDGDVEEDNRARHGGGE